MKKLLLVLVLLAGSVLPSMAHRCQEEDLEHYIYANDLECVKYLVDLMGMDSINEDPQLSANLFLDILFRSNFKVFSFMIDNGLTDKYIEGEWFEFYLTNDSRPGDSELFYNSLDFKKFEFLLNKRNIWSRISDAAIYLFIDWICIEDLKDTSFIEFLINLGMPESEYDRYIEQTNKIMDNLEYINMIDVKSYEEIIERSRKYEVAKQILALFGKTRVIKYQPVYENMDKILNENMQKYMEEYKQQNKF